MASSADFASDSAAFRANSGACANFCSSLASVARCSSVTFCVNFLAAHGFVCFCLVSALAIFLSRYGRSTVAGSGTEVVTDPAFFC